jgi:hypothetical protein
VEPVRLELPNVRTIVGHALPRVVEGTLIPLTILVVALRLLSPRGAMAAGLVWVFLAIGVRLVLRRPVPGVLLLGAATLTARTAISLATGSVVVYFLQPSLGTMLVGTLFLLSVPLGRPLAQRLLRDFCPLSDEVHANEHVRQFLQRVSLLWAFFQLANATVTIWLLLTQSPSVFVVTRMAVSWTLTITAIVVSALWFRRSMARHGIVVTLPTWHRAGSAAV